MPGRPTLAAALALVLAVVAPVAATAATAPAPPAPAAVALRPSEALALRLAADSALAARQHARAAELYRRLLDARPGDPALSERLARALAFDGRLDEAMPHALRALEAGFADEEGTTYRLAQAHARAGRTDEALRWLERSLAAPLEDRPELKTDEAFAGLRGDPRFRALAGYPPAEPADRVAGWRLDLDFFAAEARRLHAAPHRPAHAPAFAAAVESLKARVPALDDAAVAMELQRIVARHLADGHSHVIPLPTERVAFTVLPLAFYFFSDGLHVVGAEPGHEDLVGRRVVAIGGRPVDRLLDDLAGIVSRDNDQGLLSMGPLYLRSTAVLRAMGYGTSLERVTLTLARARGTVDVTLDATGRHPLRNLPAPPGPGTPARWLARTEEGYWAEALPPLDAVYAQINAIRDARQGPSLAAFAHALRDSLRAHRARHLILDLRHNGGGNNHLLPPLVRLVGWHETESDSNRTWVITGRATFSACQNLVNRLARGSRAVFVGEPSSSRPNFTGEDTSVELPWSRLRLSISSRWWQDSEPGDRRPYVPVAMAVPYSSADWLGGRDPVMDALAEHLARR